MWTWPLKSDYVQGAKNQTIDNREEILKVGSSKAESPFLSASQRGQNCVSHFRILYFSAEPLQYPDARNCPLDNSCTL